MKFDISKSVWQERYRPQCVDDMILPDKIKAKIKNYLATGDLPNIGLWSADPGLGKSSLANAIIKETGCRALFINASLEKGIDTLRGKIMNFATSSCFDDKFKICVCDEFDNFSRDGMASFRAFLDEFSQNCRFIFTGNYKDRIIEPLLNRLENYDFANFDEKEMVKPIFTRLCEILENEKITYDKKDLVQIIKTYYPRIRSMINALQRFSVDGKLVLDQKLLDNLDLFENIVRLAKPNTYLDMVGEINKLNNPSAMYVYMYHNASKFFKPENYPNVVVTLARYQEMDVSVRDKNLNLAACLTELMGAIKI